MTDKPAMPKYDRTKPRVSPDAPPRKPGQKGAPTNVDLSDPATVDMICQRIAGGEAIYKICEELMISHVRIYQRMAEDAQFGLKISRARSAQQEAEVDKMIHIADSANEENWQVAKLRIWARQWRAAKLAPKKYGDKLKLDGDEAVVNITIKGGLPGA